MSEIYKNQLIDVKHQNEVYYKFKLLKTKNLSLFI
jgi:hypothetical protein